MISQSSFESFVQDGGEQDVQLDGGLGLQPLQRVHLGPHFSERHLRFPGGQWYLVVEKVLGVQSATANVRAGARTRNLRPYRRRAEVGIENFRENTILQHFKDWELCRNNAAIALRRHDTESSLPCHQLRIHKLTGSKPREARIGKIHSRLAGAFENAATETIESCELVG